MSDQFLPKQRRDRLLPSSATNNENLFVRSIPLSVISHGKYVGKYLLFQWCQSLLAILVLTQIFDNNADDLHCSPSFQPTTSFSTPNFGDSLPSILLSNITNGICIYDADYCCPQ